MKRVCVFCGSRVGNRPEYARAADRLAELLVERRLELIYGGAKIGLMGALADSVMQRGGVVIGVISQVLKAREAEHLEITELHVVDSMHARKAEMARLADAFIALPGGLGTWEETLEMLTWWQVGIHDKPCGVLNINGYFTPLVELLDQAHEEGFLHENPNGLLLIEDSPGALLERLTSSERPRLPRWERVAESSA